MPQLRGLLLRNARRFQLSATLAASSGNRLTAAAQSAVRPLAERMEDRLLLSAYTLNQVAQFGTNATGIYPQSSLVADSSGNFYGTASEGGAYGVGTVFEVASGSAAITTLASFNGVNGQVPLGGVSLDASGNIFGTTSGGVPGSGGDYGTVFEIARGSNAVTTLASVQGVQPGVTIDSAGNLYGTDHSTVFEIARGSNAVTTIASFNGEVQGGLMMDAAGNLYGTNKYGGANGDGAVFEIARGSTTVTTLASLGPASMNGAVPTEPWGGVTMDSSGNLYGAAMGMPDYAYIGSVFELPKGSNVVTALASFTLSDGAYPAAGVTLDASGNLYGALPGGSASNFAGSLFEIARGTRAATTLVSFDATQGANGATPNGGLLRDASGNLFGTAEAGGPNGAGVVFELPKGTSAVTAVASFAALRSGPRSSLTRDASGDLFGTMGSAGQGYGLVFEIADGSNVVTTLAAFNAYNIPAGPLSVDASGNLYYTAPGSGFGTVCEIAAGSGAITTRAALNRADGYYPVGGVVIDALGNIYGAADEGGADNLGTIFEIARGSAAITTLASFNGTNGAYPGRLIEDASGDLYGAAGAEVFELPKGSNTITDLASFGGADGTAPQGIALDATGNLYGTAEYGGASGDGTVLEIPKGSGTITVLASFSGTDGKGPTGVTPDASGNLFGATVYGGQNGDGTLFEIGNGSNVITTLVSFNGTDGINPGRLTPDGLGNFYGTAAGGLGAGTGTIFELTANTTITLTAAGGPNPSTPGQSLGFTATVTGGVPDGEMVSLLDTSNNNAIVATGTISNGSAALTVPAGALMPGTHKLIAAYAGDANFAACQSVPFVQTVNSDALPSYITASAGAAYGYNSVTGALNLSSGTLTFIADNGTAPLVNLTASGPASGVFFDTSEHLAGLTLSGGARATVLSLGSGRTHVNHNVLVIGSPGSASDPAFSIDASSKLDMTDNDLIVHTGTSDVGNGVPNQLGVPTTSELGAVRALALAGRHVAAGSVLDGTWTGNGLTSSSAASADAAAGYEQNVLAVVQNSDQMLDKLSAWTVGSFSEPLGPNDILVKYTYDGDAALEGFVGDNSVPIVSRFFDAGKSGQPDWAFGDFTDSGTVNDDDITILDGLYGNGTAGSGLAQL